MDFVWLLVPMLAWLAIGLAAYAVGPRTAGAVVLAGMLYGLYRLARSVSRDGGGGGAQTAVIFLCLLAFIGLLWLLGGGDDAGIPYRGM